MSPLILLCGGQSKRMGNFPKPLIKFNGKHWLETQLESIQKSGLKQVIIVLGFHSNLILSAIPFLNSGIGRWGKMNDIDFQIALNKTPEQGPFSSIQAGVRLLQSQNENDRGVFIQPVDTPVADSEVWSLMESESNKNYFAVIPSFSKKNGHPVWIGENLMKKITDTNLPETESRLDLLINTCDRTQKRVVAVADSSVIMNLNTPEEWHEFKSEVTV